jgi:hypothetical protein
MSDTTQKRVRDATAAVNRVLHTGIPKLVLFSGTEHELVLRAARKGDIIEDPECDADFQALESGIFQRCKVTSHGALMRLCWMFLCSSDDLPDVLAHHPAVIDDTDIGAIGFDACWQSIQWEDVQRRRAARKRFV